MGMPARYRGLQGKVLPRGAGVERMRMRRDWLRLARGDHRALRDEHDQRRRIGGPDLVALAEEVEELCPMRGVARRPEETPRLRVVGGGGPARRLEEAQQRLDRDRLAREGARRPAF